MATASHWSSALKKNKTNYGDNFCQKNNKLEVPGQKTYHHVLSS